MIRVNKTFTKINFYKNIKPVLINNQLKFSSHTTNTSNDQIENEEELELNNIFKENTLLNEIKRAEKTVNLNPNRALKLLNNCGPNFVDVFHDKRQYYLDYLFNKLFVSLGLKFKQEYFDSYTKNTLNNLSSFDPFNISNDMSRYNLKGNLSINTCLIKQLCEINKLNYALVHLKSIVQSNNLDLIDLKNYDNSPYLTNNNVYELFHADINNLNLKNSTNYIQLFNPILEKLIDLNDLKNSFNLLELIDKLNLKPNNKTYLNLINGHLKKLNYVETLNNLDKYHKYLKLNDKLELYFTNCLIKKDLKQQQQQDDINVYLFENKIQTEFDQNDRIVFINIIMRLCKENMYDEAFYLVSNFFRTDLFETDAEKKETNLNLGDFFFKSLVEYENSLQNLLNYAKKQGDLEQNYKSLLHHTLLKQNSEMSLKIIKEFEKNEFKLKSCYFYPIMAREANSLDEYLKVNKNVNELDRQLNFRRILSILKKIRHDYNLVFNVEDMNILLNILKFVDENEPKKYLKYIHIAQLFDRENIFDTKAIFNVLSNKILSYRLKYIKKNRNLKDFNLVKEQIDDDLNELNDLITFLNVTRFDQKFLTKLNDYLHKLFNTNLVYDKTNLIENTTIFKLVNLINRQSVEQPELLNNSLLDLALTNLRENRTKQEVKDIFDKMTLNNSKEPPKQNKYPIAGFENKNETIESLTNLYNEMKDKGKNTSGSIIRLLIELCNASDDYIKDPFHLIQKYTEMLPEDKYTPLLCENLMAFYAEKTFNIEKATMYYSKLKKRNEGTFDVSPIKLLPYLENLYKNYPDIKNINDVFKSLSWNQSNEDNKKAFDRLIDLLSGRLFEKTSANDYNDLAEKIFQSNFMGRNETIINLSMLKYFKNKEIDEAFEYFKSNLIKYKISASEILLLKEYLKLYEEKKMKDEKLEELLDFFSKYYDTNLAYNFFFWAYILNGNFESASQLYHRSLEKKLDLNVLKRLSKQLNSNKLYAKYLHCLRKIFKFNPIMRNESLCAEFTNIIDKKD